MTNAHINYLFNSVCNSNDDDQFQCANVLSETTKNLTKSFVVSLGFSTGTTRAREIIFYNAWDARHDANSPPDPQFHAPPVTATSIAVILSCPNQFLAPGTLFVLFYDWLHIARLAIVTRTCLYPRRGDPIRDPCNETRFHELSLPTKVTHCVGTFTTHFERRA